MNNADFIAYNWGRLPADAELHDYVRVAAERLGLQTALAFSALRTSLTEIDKEGKPRKRDLRACAFRVALHAKAMFHGFATPETAVQELYKTWVLAVVHDVAYVSPDTTSTAGSPRASKPRLAIAWKVLSSPAAGKILVDHIPVRYGAVLFREFTGGPRKTSYASHLLLSGLLAGIQLTYKDGLKIEDRNITVTLQKKNCTLTRKRFRELTDCPFSYAVDCVLCHRGRDTCANAVLPLALDE